MMSDPRGDEGCEIGICAMLANGDVADLSQADLK